MTIYAYSLINYQNVFHIKSSLFRYYLEQATLQIENNITKGVEMINTRSGSSTRCNQDGKGQSIDSMK